MREPVQSIHLGEYSVIGRLIDAGGDGQAERIGGEWWLRGSFALELFGRTSAGSEFVPSMRHARLYKTDDGWTLAEITNRLFQFEFW